MKVAVVGAGGMGGVHLNVYTSMSNIHVVGIVDPLITRGAAKAESLSIPVYRDLNELFEATSVDFIDICAPTGLHVQHAITAMERGVHVLCEKPISLTVEEGRKMIESAKLNGVTLMIAHVIRFWPEYMILKQIMEEGRYGKLHQLWCSRISPIPRLSSNDWMLKPSESGRAPIDLHIHDTDFILYLLGHPRSVTSFGKELDRHISYIKTHYEYDHISVEAEGGWYGSPIPFEMSFRATFEQAAVVYQQSKLWIYEQGKDPQEIGRDDDFSSKTQTDIKISHMSGYYNEIKYFIDCLRSGKQPILCTPESSLESLALVQKELESVKTGRKISLQSI